MSQREPLRHKISKYKPANGFKRKDESHLLSLSSMKLNKKRDKNAFLLGKINSKRKNKGAPENGEDESSNSVYLSNEELFEKVRESFGGRIIDDSVLYYLLKKAKEEEDIRPNREIEKFIYFVHEELK